MTERVRSKKGFIPRGLPRKTPSGVGCRACPAVLIPFILALLFFSLPLYRAAAETLTLTIDEAVRRALDNSINLRKSAIDLSQTEYSAGRLWSEIFPSFSAGAGLTFLPSTPLFSDPGYGYKSENLSYSLSFGVSLSLTPAFRASMRRIELAYRSRLLSYESASRQLEIQVIKIFLNLVTRKAYIAFMEETLETAVQRLEKDRIARQNGLLSEVSWLNSLLSVETARYNLNNARGTYENSLGEFLALLGLDSGVDLVLQGSLDIAPVPLNPEELIAEYLPKRPDILSQLQTIERLELSQRITTLNSRVPSLSLSTQWRGGSPSSNRANGLADPFADSITGTLSLTIPVDSWIPGTRQNQAVRETSAELEKAILDLRNTETQARTEIRSLTRNLANIRESLEIARLRLQIAQSTALASEIGFRNGTVESRDLEDANNKLSDARQQLLQSELSHQSLFLDLAAALNVDWKKLISWP
jgi:multidrug efflux system outer membrane protein